MARLSSAEIQFSGLDYHVNHNLYGFVYEEDGECSAGDLLAGWDGGPHDGSKDARRCRSNLAASQLRVPEPVQPRDDGNGRTGHVF